MELLVGAAFALAQRTSSYESDAAAAGIFAFLFVVYLVIVVGFYAFFAYCYQRVFQKAGLPGWWGWVPFVNYWGMVKLSGREEYWFVLMLIPCVNWVVLIIISMDIARAFGKDQLWGLGLAFLSFIFWPILAFGDSRYVGNPQLLAAGGYGGPGYGQPPYGQPYPQQPYPQQPYPQQPYGQPPYGRPQAPPPQYPPPSAEPPHDAPGSG